MTRTVDLERRQELLDAMVDYVFEHGLGDLSLRPLAEAVGSSPRALLYHFGGSKDELMQAIIGGVRKRQVAGFAAIRDARYESASDACLAVWNIMIQPKMQPLFTLFFELFAMGLRDRKRFRSFLHHAIEDWIEFFGQPLRASGVAPDEARAYATVMLAGFRGFLMDYCATRDRERVTHALTLWLESLNLLACKKERPDAR